MSSNNRQLWAIRHKNGVSLIKAGSGPNAIRRAEKLLGECLGPYRVEKNQDQSIIWARAMGAKEM